MNNSQERYNSRMQLQYGDKEISSSSYHMLIGAVLAYGFLVNIVMVAFFGDSAISIFEDNYLPFLIMYIVCCIVGSMMINKSNNPVISFIGYNLFVIPIGIMLSALLSVYVSAGYSDIIATAFGITAIVTIGMMFLASLFQNFFLSLGRTLFTTLALTLVVELVMFFLGADLGIIDYIVVLIFCGYIGYDWSRANACAKTADNAVDCAAGLYLDIINLFLRLLRILARANRN